MTSACGIRFIQRLSIACLAALFSSLAAKSAFACTPSPPTPWFNENVHLADTARPSGILITQDVHNVFLTNNLDTSSFYINLYNGPRELGKSVELSSDYNILTANGYHWINLEPRNIMQDNRPADVKLPESQVAVAEMSLNQKTYDFQLTISYELNYRYQPDSVYSFGHACEGFYFNNGLNYPVLLIVGFLILLVIVYAINILKENNGPHA